MLYAGSQPVAQGPLGPELANNTETQLAAAATVVFGGWAYDADIAFGSTSTVQNSTIADNTHIAG